MVIKIAIGDLFSNGDQDRDCDLKFDRDRDRDCNFRNRGHALGPFHVCVNCYKRPLLGLPFVCSSNLKIHLATRASSTEQQHPRFPNHKMYLKIIGADEGAFIQMLRIFLLS